MKDVIGISAYYHDSSVALIRDGQITAFIKEESLTRIKGISSFPKQSLEYLVNNYQVTDNTLDLICFYEKPLRGWLSLLGHSLEKPVARWRQTSNLLRSFWDGPVFIGEELKKLFPTAKKKLIYSEHHLSHALTGIIHADPDLDWTAIILDGVGDGETGSIFSIRNHEFKRLWTQSFPNSIGLFYSAITDFLGYAVNDGEYKIMALASYGTPKYQSFMLDKIINFEKGELKLNLNYFDFQNNPERSYSEALSDILGPPANYFTNPHDEHHPEFTRFSDIAASAQATLVTILKKIISFSIKQFGSANIIFSGGVAQNCAAISNLISMPEIDQLIVPPSPGDSGAALGAAIYGHLYQGHIKLPDPILYPGPISQRPKIMDEIFKLDTDTNTMLEQTAQLLKDGNIIATFIDHGEMGPRALGHRSLLCNASEKKIVEKLNTAIKKRERYRPLAPILTEISANNLFKIDKNNSLLYTWMASTATAIDQSNQLHSGILHVDGSARIQTVPKDQTIIWQLLSSCEALDMPILVNTSFNISGDPIVFDYIDCFVNMTRMNIKWLLTGHGLYERIDV